MEPYKCTIIENNRLTDTAFSITAEAHGSLRGARAGQFAHIKCGDNRLLRRPISICSVSEDTLQIVFEPRGDGTHWLAERKPGDVIDILGPLGNGFDLPEGKLIAVGGGIGVPPVLFAASTARGEITAILGFRNAAKIMLQNEFEKVCEEVYITTDDGSFGIHGAVTGPLEDLLNKGGYDAVLACGPRAMLSAVASLCKSFGVSCQVSLEERMGCGVGACLVCACGTVKDGETHMSRVCRDGPVFEAGEVVWQ